ncbi:WD40-repeat-containing domain protein [Cyathus striatus]|nr:WD40-repeat-containing domain protein [Cyathus striatus]
MRSASSSSLRADSPAVPQIYSEVSAKHFLRNTKITIDYSNPSLPDVPSQLLSCSAENLLFFTRGNRVNYKHLTTSEEIGQLCKLQESRGDLRAIQCGGLDNPNFIALGTTKGHVQIWDIKQKKMVNSWSTKSISAMAWNGPVLSIGGLKGNIKHFDTRICPSSKMKEQAPKVTRHQAAITSMSWNVDGKFLASGDSTGTIYCWEPGQRIPLDVGEFIQRRKKMQHAGVISAISWCPWQPRLLATGDTRGIIRLWNVNVNIPDTNSMSPGQIELDSPITSMHFSPHCKEILTTHSAAIPNLELESPKQSVANSIAVHSYPSLRHVTTMSICAKPLGESVLNAHGTKIVFSVPEESKLNVCDVWSKRKEIKKQPSFMSSSTIR